MGKANFSDDFKREAVRQIADRGYAWLRAPLSRRGADGEMPSFAAARVKPFSLATAANAARSLKFSMSIVRPSKRLMRIIASYRNVVQALDYIRHPQSRRFTNENAQTRPGS